MPTSSTLALNKIIIYKQIVRNNFYKAEGLVFEFR